MTTGEYAERLGLTVVLEGEPKTVSGCYIGDLLSWVMGKAQAGQIWLTVMSNTNVAAVASMTDVAAVVLCEGAAAEEGLIARAEKLGLPVYATSLPIFDLACRTKTALEETE